MLLLPETESILCWWYAVLKFINEFYLHKAQFTNYQINPILYTEIFAFELLMRAF